MSRVLLTGGTGFVGRHCLQPLRELGFEVHALTAGSAPELPVAVCWHRVSLFDAASLRRLVADVRPTHLLHLAWHTTPGSYWSSPENLDWCAASLGLLRLFADRGGTRFVGAGSCAEYDWAAADGPLREGATPEHPRTLYGACKKAAHDVAMALAPGAGFGAAWGRIFFLYGPGERPERLVPTVIRSLLRGQPADCTAGTQVRDFLHVADAADALVALLASDVRGAVNVASGRPVAVREIVELIGRRLGLTELIRLGARPMADDEPPALVADTGRLVREVRWGPPRSLEVGMEETIRWWQSQLTGDPQDLAGSRTVAEAPDAGASGRSPKGCTPCA